MVERLAAAALGLGQPAEEPAREGGHSDLQQQEGENERKEGNGRGKKRTEHVDDKVVPFVVEHDALLGAVEEQGGNGGKAGGLRAVAQDEGQPHAEVEVAHAAVDLRVGGRG